MLWNPTALGQLTSRVWADLYAPTGFSQDVYSHHPACVKVGSRIFVSWSQHKLAEDVVGQYVRYTYTDDNFATPVPAPLEMFPPPEVYAGQMYEADGLRLINAGFVTVASGTYAIAWCVNDSRGNQRTTVGLLYRKVDTTLGSIYLVTSMGESQLPYVEGAETAEILAHCALPENLPVHWFADFGFGTDQRPHQANITLCEPSSILLNDGRTLRFWRDAVTAAATNKWRRSIIENGIETGYAATGIPNDPSRGCFLRLQDGRILFCGNLISNNIRRVLHLAVSTTEGASWQKLWIVGSNSTYLPQYRDATKGDDSRGGGMQYPAMIEEGGKLHVFVSLYKERLLRNTVNVSEI